MKRALDELRAQVQKQDEKLAFLLKHVRAEYQSSAHKRHVIGERVMSLEYYVHELAEVHDEKTPGACLATYIERERRDVESMSATPSDWEEEEVVKEEPARKKRKKH